MLRMCVFALLLLCPLVQAEQISLQDYARHNQFISVKISPTGQYFAATSRVEDGTIQIIVIDRTSMKVISQRHFPGNDSIASFHWANKDRLVLSLARETGSLETPFLTGELFAVNADGKRGIMLTGYRSKAKETRVSEVIDWLPEDDDNIIISSYSWYSKEPHIEFYRLNIDSGRKRKLGTAPIRAVKGTQVRALTDKNGFPSLVVGVDPKDISQLLMLYRPEPNTEWRELKRFSRDGGSFRPLAFSNDNKKVFGISSTTTITDAISVLDIASGTESLIASHPTTDLRPIFSLRNGRASEVIGAVYEYDALDVTFFNDVTDAKFSAQLQGLIAAFPQQAVQINSATADGTLLVVAAESANNPLTFYLFDTLNNKVSYLMTAAPWFDNKTLPQTRIVQYKARDGQPLQGLLTLPKDKEAKALPLIMLPHGGPHGIRDSIADLDKDAKVLAENGYAVFQPNFRGSGGFGRDFLTIGYKKWGTLMIDDMTDGVRQLISDGTVDASRICSYGGSYGGYAALMSAIRQSELYKCVVNFVGVTDLALMFEEGDIPDSEIGTNVLDDYLGRSDDVLIKQSPVKNLDKLKAPVFIIHGEQDKRVPMIQAEVLRDALQKRNHPMEWLVKSTEGHGFYKPENNVERWQKMLTFFDKHIGKENALYSAR
jgi:dipeptidyl aminopeptidase/acylaminoacyl peptidase